MGRTSRFPPARGVYVLWLYLPEAMTIKIGKLGSIDFTSGVYAYVGSAQRNLHQRVARHARLEKKLHWHIDYFRHEAQFLGSVLFLAEPKDKECWLVKELLKIPGSFYPSLGFGSSDCNCSSHFLQFPLLIPREQSS